MELKRNKTEFKALTKVVRKASLQEIFLQRCHVERDLNALDFKKVGADISFSSILSHEVDNDFHAESHFVLIGRPEGEKEKEAVKIDCTYLLKYRLDSRDDITPEDLKIFCSMNALYNAWPFFRELVLNMSNRMEVPPLTLPLLKFIPKKDNEKPPEI